MAPRAVELNLVENALDFGLSAAEQAQGGSPRDLKYAILHLAAGIELLLKARLYEEHWSFVFADVDKANISALKSGDFKSVDFESACCRLRQLAAVNLPREDLKHLNKLRGHRNKIQHFAVKIEEGVAKSLLAFGHNFVTEFVKANLESAVAPYAEQLARIRNYLAGFRAYVDHRLETPEIKRELEAAERIVECPRCLQDTMVLDNGEPRCLFCDLRTDYENLALEQSETGDVRRCPACGELACSFVIFNNEDAGWYCIACEKHGDYRECMYCDEGLTTGGDVRCSQCRDYVMSKND